MIIKNTDKKRIMEIEEKLKEVFFHICKVDHELNEHCRQYAQLCVDYLVETKFIPELAVFEERKKNTGLCVLHPDFWNPHMICALAEEYRMMERKNGST